MNRTFTQKLRSMIEKLWFQVNIIWHSEKSDRKMQKKFFAAEKNLYFSLYFCCLFLYEKGKLLVAVRMLSI